MHDVHMPDPVSNGPVGKQRRAEEVYQRLRGDIFAARLQPGQRLKFAELCATYDTSVGVAREALTRLAAERLVIARDQHGYTVVEFSEPELTDLTAARIQVESLICSLARRYQPTWAATPCRTGARFMRPSTARCWPARQADGCKRSQNRCAMKQSSIGAGLAPSVTSPTEICPKNIARSPTRHWPVMPTGPQKSCAITSRTPHRCSSATVSSTHTTLASHSE